MKEASVKKLFIKAFSADGSTKSLLVDEKMTCAYVTRLLADKNHVHMDPKWGIVEHLPDLYMGKFEMLIYFWACCSLYFTDVCPLLIGYDNLCPLTSIPVVSLSIAYNWLSFLFLILWFLVYVMVLSVFQMVLHHRYNEW